MSHLSTFIDGPTGPTGPTGPIGVTGATGATGVSAIDDLTTNLTASGIKESIVVGESVSFGNVLYLKSDGKWWKSDANSLTTMPATRMALETKSADQSCESLVVGNARNDAWSWSIGGSSGFLYTSASSGVITQTATSTSGSQLQVLGIATASNKVFFNPSLVLVEVA